MMSLTTYALVLVPCLVGGAAALGVVTLRRSAARLDRRAARIVADTPPPRQARAFSGTIRRVAGR
ncbi:hypothetical protein [Methylobacterium nonmethylotrophicum]|uniref:Uncharacterized protein n=1 Tax=Methylobacterium nonmethylotrophicum TaxID=1141884 RepID=A0A4Z0NWD2_9HYPH|nr:hypothetical protein [Methylobacterium nonmethylotrophicum]TGE01450.1 hypothetical protein EU555_04930 [Methylobacterium nonmethylotrophicum]